MEPPRSTPTAGTPISFPSNPLMPHRACGSTRSFTKEPALGVVLPVPEVLLTARTLGGEDRRASGTRPDPVLPRTASLPRTESVAAVASPDRLHTQATESVRRDALRVREISDRFRGVYRRRLEEWLQMRARLDQQLGRSRGTGPGLEQLRSEHEALGRELAALQGQLMRFDVAARQLEMVSSYLTSPDPEADEPTLTDVDLSQASLSLRIIQAQEGERQHLAEEIHDGPAQVLTNAIFQVEYLDRVIDDSPQTAHAELAFLLHRCAAAAAR
ncbi:MAG: hypothetical protein E6J47_05260 [Chloroflexi bacterium]|nr:MAG: hypothetical protein E6J47_05260 [Chloroflexota bacterium]